MRITARHSLLRNKNKNLLRKGKNSAKLFTNGEYPLAALKTIVENILIRQIKDPDITVNISQVKEDLLVIMIMK